jgi:phosphate transport system substrate-binding protein
MRQTNNWQQSKSSSICPRCHAENELSSKQCRICQISFSNEPPKAKSTKYKSSLFSSFSTSEIYQKILNVSGDYLGAFKRDLQKPSSWLGLVVFAVAVTLWGNYFLGSKPTEVEPDKPRLQLSKSIERVKNVPRGLFSYGGAAYFAPLVAYGLNDAISQAHPEFKLLYTEPPTFSSSYAAGIEMLIEGQISFAFNSRPLKDVEFERAKQRGIGLRQEPIALDGVVVFVNSGTGISAISLDKVRDIFAGKIINWNQLGGIDLPIVPVLLSDEELEILGVGGNAATTTQYAQNHTQVLRKVIGTPGSIAFASASLVANQKLIKTLDLAAPHSNNFVRPFVADKPNLEAFESGVYPLTRRQFLVIREDRSIDELAGYAYLNFVISQQGQGYVEKAGSVSIY